MLRKGTHLEFINVLRQTADAFCEVAMVEIERLNQRPVRKPEKRLRIQKEMTSLETLRHTTLVRWLRATRRRDAG